MSFLKEIVWAGQSEHEGVCLWPVMVCRSVDHSRRLHLLQLAPKLLHVASHCFAMTKSGSLPTVSKELTFILDFVTEKYSIILKLIYIYQD